MGRDCAAHCAALAGLLAGRPAPVRWLGQKTIQRRKKRKKTRDRCCFFFLLQCVLDRSEAGRERPWRTPGGRPAAGTGRRWSTAARGGGMEGGGGLQRTHPSSRSSGHGGHGGRFCGEISVVLVHWMERAGEREWGGVARVRSGLLGVALNRGRGGEVGGGRCGH